MKKIWGIKNCNSVKKALDFLNHKQIAYDFVDYKKTPPNVEKITQWIEKAGIEQVLNIKGMTYKKMGVKDMVLSLQEKIELMHQNPTLIKRPILEDGDRVLFGFSEDEYEKIL